MLRVKKHIIFFYLLPALVLIAAFIFFPIILNFIFSFYRWSSFSPEKTFIGFDNFTRLFKDPVIGTALINNIAFALISIFFQVGISMIIAAVLEEKWMQSAQPLFRTIYFLPSMISLTVVSLLWQTMYSPMYGIINPLLESIGLGAFTNDWLGNTKTAIYSVIMVSQWQYIGYTMVLFLVAMQKISLDLYEAAVIDGANSFQRFIYITIPGIKEMLLVNVMTTIIGAFKVFDAIYIMTSGGPGRSTEVLGSYLFRTGFRNDEMGYASAIASLVFVITFALSIIQLKMSRIGEEGN